jgi:LPXTG-motif cell wall-anchored protein
MRVLWWILVVAAAAVILSSLWLIFFEESGNWFTVIGATCTLIVSISGLLAIRRSEASNKKSAAYSPEQVPDNHTER